MRKLFITVSIFLISTLLYAGSFPCILAHKADTIARGEPYCIVIPITEPYVFSGWTVPANQRLRKINDFRDLSLFEILTRRWRGNTSDFRYTQPIHLGIVVQGKAYHWSFAKHAFIENDTYVDFRREFNRAASFPEDCVVP